MTTLTFAGAPAPDRSKLRSGGKRDGALSTLRRCLDVLAREYRIHRGTRAMMALDDRMLRDIGLARTEIGSAALYGRARTG
jgi:uncharacterized protein YjiS (DUF1127 family)